METITTICDDAEDIEIFLISQGFTDAEIDEVMQIYHTWNEERNKVVH